MILAGTVEKIFKSDSSSYKLLSIKASEDLITVIIEGNCPELRQNDLIVLEGDFKISKRFGSYFKGSILQALGSDTSENLVKFLVNLRVKGLGFKTAHRVVKFLRESNQTLENFASTSTWKAIPQVNIRVTRELAKKLQSLNLEERVILNLVKLGIGLKTSQDLWAAKGPLAISAVLADPYKTLLEFPGYRFKRLDALAKKLGIKEEDNRRIKGAILSALMEACEEGHTGLPLAKLTEKVKELTSLSKETLIAQEIRNLELESRILITPQLAQLRHISDLEKNVAQQLKKAVSSNTVLTCNLDLIDPNLSSEQRDIFSKINTSNLGVLTGGPGTGKTTVIASLSKIYTSSGYIVKLAAPTGRAAQKLSSLCQLEAHTIHRLIKLDPLSKYQFHNASNPIRADLIIVDEASMLDLEIFYRLMLAVSEKTKILFVGDKDQLPPVGLGNPFSDLLGLPNVFVVKLNKIFRRSEGSEINHLASLILQGDPKSIKSFCESSTEITLSITHDTEDLKKKLEKLIRSLVLPHDPSFASTLILTPTARGQLGSIEINKLVISCLRDGAEKFMPGDKVIQTVNNYDLQGVAVFNGDIGYIREVSHKKNMVIVEFWDGRLGLYDSKTLPQLQYAYALTVHKAQGQESDHVILVLDKSHFMLLNSALFYTAVTRAKKKLHIISSIKALWIATLKGREERHTNLKHFFQTIPLDENANLN